MAFDQGASRPKGTITAKSTRAPQNASRLKLKKIQRIQRNIDGKKLVSSLFFILIFFLFSAKSGGGGAKKCGGAAALPAPPPPRSLLKECEGWLQKATFVMLRVFEENIVKINKTNS